MSKISFADILSGFSTASALNQNFNDLEAEFQDKVLYRDNPAGEPNQMENDLDMNSHHILNATTDLSSPTSLLNITTADGRYFRLINKGPAAEAGTKNSVEIDVDDIQLVGDELAPGNNKYYGTDINGDKGFYDISTSSSVGWGNITGTLSNQTDLQSALDSKLDSTAQASDSDQLDGQDGSYYLDRTNHIGTQSVSTLSDAGTAATADTKESIEIDAGDLHLVGDATAPGNNKYYGTDGAGVKGFFEFLVQPSDLAASNIEYDNTSSGLTATDVQAAIDEVDSNVDSTESSLSSHTGDLTIHRSINDAGTAMTDLWSADKIGTELSGKLDTTAQAADSDLLDGQEGTYYLDRANHTGTEILQGLSSPSYTQGQLFYDTDSQALAFDNDESDVRLNIGQEAWVRVWNETGGTVSNGSAVYISGSHSGTGLPTIALAQADARSTCETFIGLATHDIPNNSSGFVTEMGVARGLDTSAYTNGEPLYLSADTPGAYTSTAPSQRDFIVPVGIVTNAASGTAGRIQVLISGVDEGLATPGTVPFGGSDGYLDEDTDFSYDRSSGALSVERLMPTIPLEIFRGGTGASTASLARTNLGLGTAAEADLTTSATDTTAGRVTQTGDFGLGRDTAIPQSDFNTISATGFYRTSSTSQPEVPGGNAHALVISHRFNSVSTRHQLGFRATEEGIYYRKGDTDWDHLYRTGNILGTVSQTGGVPTEAIFEKGSNSNGEYVKFADGTMICTFFFQFDSIAVNTAVGSLYKSAQQTWTFPAAFDPDYRAVVNGSVFGTFSSGSSFFGGINTSDSFANYYLLSALSNNSVSPNARLVAFGRWFL